MVPILGIPGIPVQSINHVGTTGRGSSSLFLGLFFQLFQFFGTWHSFAWFKRGEWKS